MLPMPASNSYFICFSLSNTTMESRDGPEDQSQGFSNDMSTLPSDLYSQPFKANVQQVFWEMEIWKYLSYIVSVNY